MSEGNAHGFCRVSDHMIYDYMNQCGYKWIKSNEVCHHPCPFLKF